MNICLIFPSHDSLDNTMPNLSVYLIASVLRENGHNVDVYDQGTYFERRKIIIPGYDIICISSNSFTWCNAKIIIAEIKKHLPLMPVVLGGVHPSKYDKYIMQSTQADYIVVGEGEHCIIELINALSGKISFDKIRSLTYRDKNGAIKINPPRPMLSKDELAELPVPAYDLITSKIYHSLTYEFSRGCANSCVFCSSMYINKWRPFPLDKLIDNLVKLEPLLKIYDYKVFAADDCFTTSKKRLEIISETITKLPFPIELGIEARVIDLLKDDISDYLWNINLFYFQIGIECGYNRGLALINKRINIEQIIACAERLTNEGLIDKILFSFIIGFPWEGKKDCLTTIHFAAELVDKYGGFANIAWWIPLPSKLWDTRDEYGCRLNEQIFDDIGWTHDMNIFKQFHPALSVQDIQEISRTYNTDIARNYNVNLSTSYLGTKADSFHTLMQF